MKQLYVILFAIVFSTGASTLLQAQNAIFFENTNPKAYLIRHGNGGPSSGITDKILTQISQYNQKSLKRTELIYAHEEFIRLTKRGSKEFQVYAALRNPSLKGDINYRGFKLVKELKPAHVNFEIEQLDMEDHVVQTFGFKEVPLKGKEIVLADFKVADTLENVGAYKARIVNQEFIYTQKKFNRFEATVQRIDDYYEAALKLERIYGKLMAVYPLDFDILNQEEEAYIRLRNRFQRIKDLDYPGQLKIRPRFDPADFLKKQQALEQELVRMEQGLAETRANLPTLYYQRGVARIQEGDRDGGRQDLLICLELVPGYGPAHMALGNMAYQEGRQEEALEAIRSILGNANIQDPQLRKEAAGLANRLYQDMIAAGRAANDNGQFESALPQIDKAIELCREFQEVACGNGMDQERIRAHAGIYQRDLNQARQAFSRGDLNAAEQSVLKARKYQQSQKIFLPDGAEAEALLLDIKSRQHKNLIQQGDLDLGYRKWQDALAKYEAAKAIEREYPVKKDTLVFGKMQQAAKPMILKYLREGIAEARANRLNEARGKNDQARDLQAKYYLDQDQEIAPLKEQLKSQIFTQECQNAKDQYDAELNQARTVAQNKDYVGALQLFESAIAIAQNNSACGIPYQEATDGKNRVKPASDFQNLMQEIEADISRRKYTQALQNYENAIRIHHNQQLSNFGLTIQKQEDFVKNHNNRDFIYYAAKVYMDQKNLAFSHELATVLVRRNYSRSFMKIFFRQLGPRIAIRDHKDDPSTDPKRKVLDYTGGDKNWKHFYKAYVKQFKKLR